jgi:hypothetical protein
MGSPNHTYPEAGEHIARLIAEGLKAARGENGVTGQEWRRAVGGAVFRRLGELTSRAWRLGWQPAELARHVGRELTASHVRMVADMAAADLRSYAPPTVDHRWRAQVAALPGTVWWERDEDYLWAWGNRSGLTAATAAKRAIEVIHRLGEVTPIPRLLPPPGAAREGGSAYVPGSPGRDRVLTKVRALLAKATSTEFEAEAEALTARAQELMARHSIDAALLTTMATGPDDGPDDGPDARRLPVDNPYATAKATLLTAIAHANRCRAVHLTGIGLVTVFGFPCDVDGVELLFTSLLVQATAAMVAAGPRTDARGRSRTRSFRHSFLTAYATRIGERLREAADSAREAAMREHTGSPDVLLPVLAARDDAVDAAMEAMFPVIRQSGPQARDHDGWVSGRAAADLASLTARTAVGRTGRSAPPKGPARIAAGLS